MARADADRFTAVVISDDDDLGGLLALNLRRRDMSVEQTDFRLAASPRWCPANGRPSVLVINAEKSTTDPLAFLRVTRDRTWLMSVPIVLAADNSVAMVAKFGGTRTLVATELDDVGAIVAAALALLPLHRFTPMSSDAT